VMERREAIHAETRRNLEMQVKAASSTVPNQFYSNARLKKDTKGRHRQLTMAANQVINLAVNNGNDETFRHVQARLGQATYEVRNIIKQITGVAPITLDEALPLKPADGQAGDKSDDSSADDIPVSSLLVPNPPVGQAKNKKAIVADNSTNNSRLCQGGRGKATSGAKKSRRKTKLVAGTSKSLSIYQANKNRQPTNTKPMPKSKAVSVLQSHARDNVVQLRRKRRALLVKIRFRRSC